MDPYFAQCIHFLESTISHKPLECHFKFFSYICPSFSLPSIMLAGNSANEPKMFRRLVGRNHLGRKHICILGLEQIYFLNSMALCSHHPVQNVDNIVTKIYNSFCINLESVPCIQGILYQMGLLSQDQRLMQQFILQLRVCNRSVQKINNGM